MSSVRRKPVVAIFCADIHISERAPVCRSGESDWMVAQARYLGELQRLSKWYDAPIVCAGDLFHKPKPSVELVNWTHDHLPDRFYAIPGNHDLPGHRMDQIDKSGFGALLRMGKLQHIGIKRVSGNAIFYGNPLGGSMECPGGIHLPDYIRVLVTHEYVHTASTGYPGAGEPLTVDSDRFVGWDLVVCGDNHIPFTMKLKNGTTVVNCGCLFVRTVNDFTHGQYAWLLHHDGTVTPRGIAAGGLDAPYGRSASKELTAQSQEIIAFVDQLSDLRKAALDFREAIMNALRGVPEPVKEAVLKAMEGYVGR